MTDGADVEGKRPKLPRAVREGEEKRERPRVRSNSPKYLTRGIVGNWFPHNLDLTTIDNLAGRATDDFDARRS
jgi:hypothetical protein